jgi:NAD(P)-dependent dehydrogenase (short-subunit alcohol dehydrogenase family)
MSLENRTVVITGAAGRAGAQLGRDLAAQGANLALLGRDAAHLNALAGELALPAPRFLTLEVNLLDLEAAKAAASAMAERFGRVDVLLHTVGGWVGGKTLVETPTADLELMLQQNVWAAFNAVQAFVPYLVKNGWGRVVMISSPAALRPGAKGGVYAIGKAGQEALMLALSQELKGTGVTANLLQVNTIDTKRLKVHAPAPENAAWSTPEEISSAVQFLLSDEGGALNGARLPLFGAYA